MWRLAAIRPAEKLPIQTLPRLNQSEPGTVVPFETEEAIILYFVIAAQPAPLSRKTAEAAIYQHLEQLQAKEALDKSVSNLRSQSEIELFSDFSTLLD